MSVVSFPGGDWRHMRKDPDADLPAADVLNGALERDIRAVVVLGLNEDGTLFGASSSADLAQTLLLIDRVRQRLMAQFDEDAFG